MSTMSRLQSLLLFSLITILALGLAACSDSDDPADPGGGGDTDTTAPQVAGVDPGNGEAGVAVDEDIVITFSEPMDTATSAGQVTLSSGTITGLSWSDSRNLVIAHTDWNEGIEITVTLGTGLADVAGNTLATAFSSSFFTFTAALTLLETNPADGATDVNRDSNVQLLFSQQPTLSSVNDHITIADPGIRATYDFEVDINDELVTLNIQDRLPGSTEITVTLGAGLETWGGTTLGSDHVFSFTTGEDVDETPPTVLSSYPAVGSTCAADVGYFQVTFSEPMNPDSFSPAAWNAELALLFYSSGGEPSWNDDYTVVTVPLPSPLPDGLPMEIIFEEFTDANGVVQPTAWTWHATVAGTPDYYPIMDDLELVFYAYGEEGDLGSEVPNWGGDYYEYLKVEMQADDSFHLARYEGGFVNPAGDYEIFKINGNVLQWLGFADDDEEKEVQEVFFDEPVDYLPLPLSAGTWSDNANVTVPGEGTYSGTLTGSVISVGDVEVEGDKADDEGIFFKDVFRVIRTLTVDLDGSPAISEVDTTWYSPTVGPFQMGEYEENIPENHWWRASKWRRFPVDDR